MRKPLFVSMLALFVIALAGGLVADTATPAADEPLVLAPAQEGCAGVAALALPAEAEEKLILFPTPCGDNVCGPGQYCCNPSCGTCANRGDYCLDVICNPTS